MRTTSLLVGIALGLAMSSVTAQAQTPNTGSGGDVYASDGGAGARWWNQKAQQYPLCAGPAKEGATLTGQIVEEAYKKPEDVPKVNDLGAQREVVKHELQTCIAQNYTLQGGVKETTQSDPGGDGTGTPGYGTPGTGKTTPPPKKQPPLSGGTQKGGGSGNTPGHSKTPPANTGHGNLGPHTTPPLWVGTVTFTWKEVGHRQPGNVPYRQDATDTLTLEIWDVTDPHVPLKRGQGSLFGVTGAFANGTFTIAEPNWKDATIRRTDLKFNARVKMHRNF